MDVLFLYADSPVTRRQRMHHVMEDNDMLLFSAAKIEQCLAWIGEQECERVVIVGDDHIVDLEIRRVVKNSFLWSQGKRMGAEILAYLDKRSPL